MKTSSFVDRLVKPACLWGAAALAAGLLWEALGRGEAALTLLDPVAQTALHGAALALLLALAALWALWRQLEGMRRAAHISAGVRRQAESGLLALGLALEERGFETPGHTERVSKLALAVGRALGLDESLLVQLRYGAYLHDLGKLSVPDEVFSKRDQLGEAEWNAIRAHPERGFELAQRLPGLGLGTLGVIRYHHERWDGRGYPVGLAGEAVPLLARIFALCDVYDALVSEHAYRPAWTPEVARMEIAAQAGRQLDPRVVEAFMSLDLAALPARSEERRASPALTPSPGLLN